MPLSDVMALGRLPSLDGLRAAAVGLVIVSHAGTGVMIPGDLGVTAFFVLSGFLITWLLLREFERDNDVSLRGFYARRTLRIFPAYYLFVIASLVADHILGDPWTPAYALAAFGYGINYYNAFAGHEGTIAHAWSLAVEEQFYLLWPIAFLLLMRRNVTALRIGLLALIAAVVSWRSFLYIAVGSGPDYVYNAFDTRFDSLAIGCLLATCITYPRVVAVSSRLARRSWYPLVTLALLFVSRTAIGDTYHNSLGFTVDSALVAVLIVQLLQLHRHSVWSVLDRPLVRYVGVLSYSLYLWHIWGLSAAQQNSDAVDYDMSTDAPESRGLGPLDVGRRGRSDRTHSPDV